MAGSGRAAIPLSAPAASVWDLLTQALSPGEQRPRVVAGLEVANQTTRDGVPFGHGLAVKHAGRSVRRAGLMLYSGLPIFFVDATDVWLAPRRQGVVVSLAGRWAGLVLGELTAGAAWLLPPGPVGQASLTWSFVFLVEHLLNLNPCWNSMATTCWLT